MSANSWSLMMLGVPRQWVSSALGEEALQLSVRFLLNYGSVHVSMWHLGSFRTWSLFYLFEFPLVGRNPGVCKHEGSEIFLDSFLNSFFLSCFKKNNTLPAEFAVVAS